MSKNSRNKKNKQSDQQNTNSKYLIVGILAIMFVIFAVMFSAVLKKDLPATGNQSGDMAELEQVMNRIATREQRLQETPEDFVIIEGLGNDYYDAGFINFWKLGDQKQGAFLWDEAIYYYLKVLEKDPDNINVRVDMATISWRISPERYDFAEEHFLKAIELQPAFLSARENFGNFLEQAKGDLQSAIVQWEAALALQTDLTTRTRLTEKIDAASAQAKR